MTPMPILRGDAVNAYAVSGSQSDAVVRLREWGTDQIHALPEPSSGAWLIGTSSVCALRLTDHYSAPKHAQLTYEDEQWWIRDLGAPSGIRQDGVLRRGFGLTSGVEVGIGATTLVAESLRDAALREFCRRLLGWGRDRLRAVDHALRAIRLARVHRSSLILCGPGDLVPIAHALHRYVLGDGAPFIVCDRRRRHARASVRLPANLPSGLDAFGAAAGGSLCLRHTRLPDDIDEIMQRLYEPDSDVQLFVCMHDLRRAARAATMPVQMPPLEIREIELPRIIEEYANDAIARLGAPLACFTDADRSWVRRNSAQSLQDIEKGTLRVVALKTSPNLSQAASRLGMAPVSLTRWLARRAPRAARRRTRSAARRS